MDIKAKKRSLFSFKTRAQFSKVHIRRFTQFVLTVQICFITSCIRYTAYSIYTIIMKRNVYNNNESMRMRHPNRVRVSSFSNTWKTFSWAHGKNKGKKTRKTQKRVECNCENKMYHNRVLMKPQPFGRFYTFCWNRWKNSMC